ncbi:GNAT family N-acetyltransferase [Actinokineospora inagensis]|uniref:GNAT family N-acetyltransferase n=1 Tax=Actinokineospora inagensis TaxID=103730 RepID=UPI00047B24BE|nr:GNAT family N-acetyltransferase [Actinokineospora inagensis]
MHPHLDKACADAWQAQHTRPLGSWRLRASGGYTGRANSAWVNGDPGVPVAEALSQVEGFAAAHGIRPYAQVVVGSRWEAELARAGWAVNLAHPRGAESAVMHNSPGHGAPTAEVADSPSTEWWTVALGAAPSPAAHHVVTTGSRVGFASAHRDGVLVGTARGCVVDDWLHLSMVEVLPTHRRQGIALELLSALDHWARGVRGRVLQVAVHNSPALTLYTHQGYRESHRYRYWMPT